MKQNWPLCFKALAQRGWISLKFALNDVAIEVGNSAAWNNSVKFLLNAEPALRAIFRTSRWMLSWFFSLLKHHKSACFHEVVLEIWLCGVIILKNPRLSPCEALCEGLVEHLLALLGFSDPISGLSICAHATLTFSCYSHRLWNPARSRWSTLTVGNTSIRTSGRRSSMPPVKSMDISGRSLKPWLTPVAEYPRRWRQLCPTWT